MSQLSPIVSARRAHTHLLTAIANLENTLTATDQAKTHPVYLQCVASALALSQHAHRLLAQCLFHLSPMPPPPPCPIAEPKLPTKETPP